MARVIVSAGHTQNEPGAVVDDLREVDLSHKIATKITQKLRSNGIITLSVPPELDLPSRIEWINNTGYTEATEDICLEIHINDGGKSGLEGWFKDKGKNKSEELTKTILEKATKKTGLENQGVKSEYDHPLSTLAFVHNTNPISSLIECLYIDNPKDQEFLKDESKLDLLADGITEGILEFLGVSEPAGSTPQQAQTSVSGQQMPNTPTFPTAGQPSFTRPASPPVPTITPRPFTPYSPQTSYGSMGALGTPQLTPQNREQNKKMIRDRYEQILGRKVSDQDMNYFLNLRLTEDQMIRRIVESQEHADTIKDSQNYKEISPKYEKQKIDNQRMKAEIKDKIDLIQKQNQLISQKNQTIQQLESQQSTPVPAVEDPYQNNQKSQTTVVPSSQVIKPQKENFFDRILKKLNDIFD